MRPRRKLVLLLTVGAAGGALGFFSAEAPGIDLPPTITLPTLPSVTLPTTVPATTVAPTLPTPAAPAPQPAPTAPSAPGSPGGSNSSGGSSAQSSPSSTGGASGGSGSSGSYGRSSFSSGPSGERPARVSRARAKRGWIARGGPAAQRSTVLVFRLSHAAVVEVTVVQVSPICRSWGRLRVRGHAGVNRIRFRGRVNGRPLPAGTYRLRARAGSGRVAVVRLVIADRRPEQLRQALAATVCSAGGDAGGAASAAAFSTSTGSEIAGDATLRQHRNGREGTPDGEVREGAVLSAQAITGPAQAGAAEGLRLGLVLALALAAAMLGLVAMPGSAIPNARIASAVVDRRLELSLAAGALMAAGAVVYLLAA